MAGESLSPSPPRDARSGSFLRTDDAESLPVDAVFELLADERRRFVLYRLVDADGSVPFDALVDWVVDRETAGLTPPRGHRRRVATSLHHCHLPQLEARGVVDYDADVVRYRRSEALERHLETAREVER